MAKKRDYVNQPAPEDVKPAGPQQNLRVEAPTKVVQLTPIVQPIAFVPYSTQEQPLFMYDDEEYVEEPVYDDDEYEDDYVEAAAPVARKRKASAAAIIVAILSLVVIGIYVIAKWVAAEYIGLIDSTAGLDIILNFFEAPEWTDIATLSILLVPVFAILTFIGALIGVMRKGVCLFAKITSAFALISALVAILMPVIEGESSVGYGLYAVAAICLINVLISWLAANEAKK